MFHSQDVIAQRYQLRRMVQPGRVLQSWLAHDSSRGVPVNLSVCISADLDMQARFERACREYCRPLSPYIERVLVHGSFGGFPYLVTEYLRGHPLEVELQREPLSPERVLALGHAIARGLESLHSQHMVHGDLCPAQLWLSSVPHDLDCKILIPLPRGADQHPHPSYASPQRRSAELRPRITDDLWSYAVILYRCLTQRLPYGRDGEDAGPARSGRFAPIRGDSAPTLNSWFFTAFHPDPDSRFSSALQMVTYLERILARDLSQLVS